MSLLYKGNTSSRLIGMAMLLLILSGCSSQVTKDGVPVIEPAPYDEDTADEALNLTHLLRDNGRYKAAYEVYKNMDEKGQLEGAFVLEYASLAASILPANEAIVLFRRAEEALPNKGTSQQRQAICVGIGRAYLILSELDNATEAFQCVLDENANSVVALNGMAVIANMQGRYDEALVHLQKAIELSPSSELVMNNLALTWISLGEYQKAISLLRTEQDVTAISSRLNLALAYVFNDREDMARSVLLETIPQKNTEKILDQYTQSRKRVKAGAPVSGELVALTHTPFVLRNDE